MASADFEPFPSDITTRPQLVEFTARFVQPPSALYITRDDELRLDVAALGAGTTVRLDARILEPSGVVSYHRRDVRIALSGQFTSETFPAAEGFLLGGALKVLTDTVTPNWVYGTVGLSRGDIFSSDILHAIARGYCAVGAPLVFPGGDYRSPTEGRGIMRLVQGADPPAGANFSLAVPARSRWRLVSLRVVFTTSAAVATRRFVLSITRAGATLMMAPSNQTQLASLTRTYSVAQWGAAGELAGTHVPVNLPANVVLEPLDVVETQVENIQAGDDFQIPSFYVEEWFRP